MQLIMSHVNLDFDALASMVAARKLFPEAKIVIPDAIRPQVRNYLALYRDVLSVSGMADIDWEKVTHLILVDCNTLKRTGIKNSHIIEQVEAGEIDITVFDHHPLQPDSIHTYSGVIEPVGAAVTLITERIMTEEIPISSLEATLFALGIYSDTGHFKHKNTTARDLQATAFLLEQGAQLPVVVQFTDVPIDEELQSILLHVLNNVTEIQYKGARLAYSWHQSEKFVQGGARLASLVLGITGADALVLILEMKRDVHLIARSKSERINLLPLIKTFGGHGHPQAAAATIKNGTLSEVIDQLVPLYTGAVHGTLTAKEVMSSPVKAVSPDDLIETVFHQMRERGHSGFPVLDGDRLVGVISRRDIDKAYRRNLPHAPVKGFMKREVITCHPDDPIDLLLTRMVKHNIGRLPVLEDNQLVGIITRTDLIGYIYAEDER